MNPRIESKEPMHFVGISGAFISIHAPDANNFEIIPALWSRFGEVAERVTDPVDHLSYGIIYGADDRSRSDELQYIAALRIWSADRAPPGRLHGEPGGAR